MADAPKKSVGEKLQSISKPTLFAILVSVITIPLFIKGINVPDEPDPPAIALFETLMDIPEGRTVLLQSDWTNGTRGESGGQFKAVLRILARRHIKACMFTLADAQAPQVARDVLRELNDEQRAHGQPTYDEWKDWVHIGFFPSAEATSVAMASDLRKAFAGRKATPPGGSSTDVFKSPVLKDVHSLKDIPDYILITASSTNTIAIERLYGSVPLAMGVTGVMGPETQVYFDSKQLVGLSKGLKGVYDLENLMETGWTRADGTKIEPFKGAINLDQGARYMPPLHAALSLLILAVVIGNIGVVLTRRLAK